MSTPVSLIVEADGGSRGNPGVAGYGALVREAASGTVLAERAAPLGQASNNVAEYSGLIAGLSAAADIDAGADVEVRMDSKLVIEQMAGRWKIKHEDMKRLALQANSLVSERRAAGGSVSWTWIPRERNKAADKLSNDGMDGHTVSRDPWRAGNAAGRAEGSGAGRASRAARSDRVEATETAGATETPEAEDPEPARRTRPIRLLLVRHGVTAFTVDGILDGRGGADPGLNELGHRQAARAAEAVVSRLGQAPDVVISSPLARARETAAPIARAFALELRIDDGFEEQAVGDWDGLPLKQIFGEDPEALRSMRNDPHYRPPGGGESHAQIRDRVLQALDRSVADVPDGGSVVVVTHRTPLMIVLGQVLQLTMERAWHLSAAPGSLHGVDWWGDERSGISFLNDTHHLRGLG